jgi:hypothetical protein
MPKGEKMVTEEDREFTITAKDGGIHKVMGKVITTIDGVDQDGNPKQSINIKVPPLDLGATPGEVK